MRPLLLAALLLALPGGAFAGAWPREPGAVFFSLKTEFDTTESRTSYYGEYGLTPRVTLGGQLGDERRDSQTLLVTRRASVFVNYALSSLDATNRFAVSAGLSAPVDATMADNTRLETSLHFGRGFASRWGNGWVTASAKLLFERGQDAPASDLYALVGLSPRETLTTMIAISRFADDEGSAIKITPSIGFRPLPSVTIVPSVTRTLSGPSETTIGLALWLSF